jgi:hypothetical protein
MGMSPMTTSGGAMNIEFVATVAVIAPEPLQSHHL